MVIAFLFKDEADWESWRRDIGRVEGKAIVHVVDSQTSPPGQAIERAGALEEVQALDDDEVDDDRADANQVNGIGDTRDDAR